MSSEQLLSNTSTDSERQAIYRWQTNPSCPNAILEAKVRSGWNESQRQALVQAVDNSLYYLSTPKAATTYGKTAECQVQSY